MRIDFFDDPLQAPKQPSEVRIKQVGIYVYDDQRRVAVGFDLTPFRKKPSLEIVIRAQSGAVAATLSVIEAIQPNFSLTMHLRDKEPSTQYTATVTVYYNVDEAGQVKDGRPPLPPLNQPEGEPPPREELPTERMVVDQTEVTFDTAEPGERKFTV